MARTSPHLRRFISDFNNDEPILNGPHAPQQLQHIKHLQQKLRHAVAELDRLQGQASGGGEAELDTYKDQLLAPLTNGDPADTTCKVPRLQFSSSFGGGSKEAAMAAGARSITIGGAPASAIPGPSPATGGNPSGPLNSARGAVTGTLARITQQAAEESAAALDKIKGEQRRLYALKKASDSLPVVLADRELVLGGRRRRGLYVGERESVCVCVCE